MKKITFYLFFCLLIFNANTFLAQHPVYYHLTEKDGLPDIEFYNILEDNKGFIWLAADKGLFRYDGKIFKNYTHQEKRGLSVFGLKKDEQGRIWCNNVSGQFFYIENDKLNLFLDIGEEIHGELTTFTFHQNKLIVNSLSSIQTYQLNNIHKTEINKSFLVKYKSTNDTLYTFKDYKILITTPNTKNKIKYNVNDYKKDGYFNWTLSTYKNKNLLYTYNLSKPNIKPKLFYEFNNRLNEIKLPNIFDNNEIINIYEADNQLWFCTYIGVYTYTLKDNQLIHQKTYFKDIDISGFLIDREQNYWFISLRNGIYIIPNLHIEQYDVPDNKKNISAISKIGKDSIYIGSVKGDLTILNTKSNLLTSLKKRNNSKIYAIGENKEKIFFSFEKASFIYDKKKKYFYQDNFLKNVKDFIVIDNNNILNATHINARITNIKSGKNTTLNKTRSYTTHFSLKKEIYVGYVDGVKKYTKENQSSKLIFNKKPIIAIDIDETSNGIIWISTLKDGIIGFKNNKPLFNYTIKNGLLSNQAGKIKGDGNLLWIATDKGLQLLNSDTGNFKNLTHKDGINSFNISGIIPFKNYVYISSNKGLLKIHKEKFFTDRKIVDFYFTSIIINDKKVQHKEKYVLKSDEKKIKFHFQTNGFLAEDDIIYTYKLLDGTVDSKWNVIEKGVNQITFNNLAAGNYTIKLKAVKQNQQKESLIKTIKLDVKLPFYKEFWFILLLSFILFWVFWKIFTKNLRKKQRIQKQQIEKERMQKELITSKLETLQSQMNPHFTFNALNSIQNLILKNKKQDAYNYLTKFSSLLRENLILSTKSFVYFNEELSIIKKYLELEKLRFRDSFTYKIIGAEYIDNVKIPTMIIQPFIENAINHGLLHKTDGVGKIKIKFYQEKNLKCIIIDNGIGIKAATKINKKRNRSKKSFSTSSISSKLKILKDYYKTDIGFTYKKIKKGTKVIIKIPYTFSDDEN